MVYDPAQAAVFRQRLLTHPGERQNVDYKASARFANDDSFSLKLIRQIQGMANTGGGWLVIGLAETKRGHVPDPAHTDDICSSYDPTPLSQALDSFIERGQDRMEVTVHFEVHPDTGLRYPEIQVEGFARVPYICRSEKAASDTHEPILRKGVVYIRRPGAETAPLSSLQDWVELLDRCWRLRRNELVHEVGELIEGMSSPAGPSRSAKEELSTASDNSSPAVI